MLVCTFTCSKSSEDFSFSFEGPFGTFDQNQLQRGLQVYTEVCSSCHGLEHVAFRTLGDPGGPMLEASQVKAYAKQFDIFDIDLDDTRPAIPSDKFPSSAIENAPCLLYTSPSPRDRSLSRMPSSA